LEGLVVFLVLILTVLFVCITFLEYIFYAILQYKGTLIHDDKLIYLWSNKVLLVLDFVFESDDKVKNEEYLIGPKVDELVVMDECAFVL
jgi:hypothetical protein